jgi:hypothetical protein
VCGVVVVMRVDRCDCMENSVCLGEGGYGTPSGDLGVDRQSH